VRELAWPTLLVHAELPRGRLQPTREAAADEAEAKAWRADAQVALRSGTRSGAKSATLSVVAATQALRLRVLPELGPLTLAEIQRADLQAFVDRLLEDDYDPSTIRNTLLPVRAIFRRAVARGRCGRRPCTRASAWASSARWSGDAIDFDRGLIHVRRTWGHIEGAVDPKSRAGRRSDPATAGAQPVPRSLPQAPLAAAPAA
jgi:hypothetical protein